MLASGSEGVELYRNANFTVLMNRIASSSVSIAISRDSTIRAEKCLQLGNAPVNNGPKHGHAMIEDIERMSGTRLGPGTLYGAITRLEEPKLIEPLPPAAR